MKQAFYKLAFVLVVGTVVSASPAFAGIRVAGEEPAEQSGSLNFGGNEAAPAKTNVPYKIVVRSGKQKESKEEKASNASNVTVQAYLVRSQVEHNFRIDKAAMRGGRKIISHASNKMTMSDVSWISRPSESSLSHSGSVCWQRRNNPPYRHKESSL